MLSFLAALESFLKVSFRLLEIGSCENYMDRPNGIVMGYLAKRVKK